MGTKFMTQYLSEIKSKVDLIVIFGSPIDAKDIIFYKLNGLPPSYQSFKTTIKTNLQPISLDDLYSFLCSEETIQLNEANHNPSNEILNQYALVSTCNNRRRGRTNNASWSRGKNFSNHGRGKNFDVECQFYGKFDYSTTKCWHRMDPLYDSSNFIPPKAL